MSRLTYLSLVGLTVLLLSATRTAAGIEGQVLSADGQPLVGAMVIAYSQETVDERLARLADGSDRRRAAAVRVGSDGVFVLEGTPTVVELEVRATGFAPSFEVADGSQNGVIVLRPAANVRGVVLAKGRPVVGATVAWMARSSHVSPPELVARTDRDGGYEVPDPRGWATGVVVTHPDFAPTLEHFMPLSPPSLRHELDVGVRITGHVVEEATGRPVQGASIAVDGWPVARTSASGSFLVAHAPPLWKRLAARAPGLVGEAERSGSPLVLSLEPPRSVAGYVRNVVDGQPLAGSVVSVYGERSQSRATAVTDEKGRYVFSHLPRGLYHAWAHRPGYRPADLDDAALIDLRRAPSATRDFHFSPLRVVKGRVQDEAGRPLSGAAVLPWPRKALTTYAAAGPPGSDTRSAQTSLDGTFTLALEDVGPETGSGGLLVLKRGYAAARLELDSEAATELLVTLTQGHELSGRVTTPDGTPVSGVLVTLVETGRYGGARSHARLVDGPWTMSDATGRFTTRVHAAAHRVSFRRPGFVTRTVAGLHPGDAPHRDVVLEHAAELRGRIIRSNGTGVGDVRVFLEGERGGFPGMANTMGDGFFSVPGLSSGSYELHFSKQGTGVAGSLTIVAPDTDLQIHLDPAATVRGRVLDSEDRRPIDRFAVHLEPSSSSHDHLAFGSFHGTSVEAAGGTFEIEDVPAGRVALAVRAEGYVTRHVEGIPIEPGDARPELEILLDSGARLRGFVFDEDGTPLAGATVRAKGPESEGAAGTADADGAYDVQGVLPGSVEIEFRADGYLKTQRTVEALGTVRLDVQLARGLSISGVVLDDGGPVPEATVTARSSVVDAEYSWAHTDDEGRFTLSGLVPGRYTVGARSTDGAEVEVEDVDVESTDWLRLSLDRLERAAVSGWVMGLPESGEVQMVRVEVRSDSGGNEQTLVDETGWFRVERATAGAVTVQATATLLGGDRTTPRQHLTLPANTETEITLEFSEGFVVTGQVVKAGAPVDGAQVRFKAQDSSGTSSSTRTDRDGRYEMSGLEPGEYRVSVWAMKISHSMTYSVEGYDELDIDVTGANLSGQVVDAGDAAPLAGASISLWRRGPGENRPDESMTSNATGHFEATFLEAGHYRLLASSEGYGQELREIELDRGDAAQVLLELEPSEGLRVAIVDARDGRPLNASVVVRDMSRRIVANDHEGVDSDGSVTIPLAPGQYLLSTSANGYGTVTRPVSAPGRGVRIGLTPGGTLILESERVLDGRVRLVGADGEEYVRCWCNGLDTIALEGRRTTIEHVTPGSYTLDVLENAIAGPSGTVPVEIREGETTRISIP